MTDAGSDPELVGRIVRGDRDAFRMLFERYQRPILNFAFRYLGRHEEAEEAVQEVFMRLFRHARRFDEQRPFKPWLYQIAVNVCHTRNHRGRRAPQPVEHELVEAAAPGAAPPEAACAEEQAERVRGAIGALPDPQRMVFVLACYQGLDYPAIAQILGIPLGTVKSRMYRAIRALREKLAGLLP